MVVSGMLWKKVGDFMLIGEFHHNIDDKGRLIIPSKFRYELGEKLVITRGLDGCLSVFSPEVYKAYAKKLDNLSFASRKSRAFTRHMLAAAECEFDRQGRINITSPLVSYADLTKECVIVGANDRLEIWSKEKWNEYFKSNEDNIEDIAEELFNSGIYETL